MDGVKTEDNKIDYSRSDLTTQTMDSVTDASNTKTLAENTEVELTPTSSNRKSIVIKQEGIPSSSSPKPGTSNSNSKKKKSEDGKPRPKRTYVKRRNSESTDGGDEKPLPKKRGRKKKQDPSDDTPAGVELPIPKPAQVQVLDAEKKPKGKSKSAPSTNANTKAAKNPTVKKQPVSKMKNPPLPPNLGPNMFDNRFLAGPHLTMKQVVEYILTDHSYCVPPDPLPAIGSNHQMIRYILGPKDGAKARPILNIRSLDSGNNSPLAYPIINPLRHRSQLASSKLEQLLKRGDPSLPISSSPSSRVGVQKADSKDESDMDVDVETVEPELEKRISYDVQKARDVMNECEKYVEFARGVDIGDDWEAKILKTGWTKTQNGLFEKVVGALHAERLARLTYSGVGDAEPVLRRSSLDRTACRVRRIFGEYLWDTKLTQWLHGVFTESLNFEYLAMYLDVLQTLKATCPQLVSRMMKLSVAVPLQNACGREGELAKLLTPFIDDGSESKAESKAAQETGDSVNVGNLMIDSSSASMDPGEGTSSSFQMSKDDESTSTSEGTSIYLPERSIVPQMKDAMLKLQDAKNAEALKSLLDRQWDPFSSILFQRLKKLASNPIFIMITPGAIFPKMATHRRLKQYHRMFSRVGQVIKLDPPTTVTSISSYLDRLIQLAKEKIKKVREQHPTRPIYLVGWGSGCILAAKVYHTIFSVPMPYNSHSPSIIEGIVALGFPLHSLRDVQDDILKIFSSIKHPILFVIGGLSTNNNLTDMELFRKRLSCETSLVVVGSGNENLYVSRDHREKLLVTQSFVDKTVMDEVAYFVNLHNQMVLPNMPPRPPQFSTRYSGGAEHFPGVKTASSILRGKKRKSSGSGSSMMGMDLEGGAFASNQFNKGNFGLDPGNNVGSPSPYGHTMYDNIPMNYSPASRVSANKRKPSLNLRTENPLPGSKSMAGTGITSSGSMTASQILQQQQTGTTKKRSSKPSGVHRPTLLNQPQNPKMVGIGVGDAGEDLSGAYSRYMPSPGGSASTGFTNLSFSSPLPFPMPAEMMYQKEKLGMTGTGASSTVEKTVKKRTNPKPKGSRVQKQSNVASLSLVSSLPPPLPPSTATLTTQIASSAELQQYLLQQDMKLQGTDPLMEAPSTSSSQVYDLILPDLPESSPVFVPTISGKICKKYKSTYFSREQIISGMKFPLVSLSPLPLSLALGGTLGGSSIASSIVGNEQLSELVGRVSGEGNDDKIFFTTGSMEDGGLQLLPLGVAAQQLLGKKSAESIMDVAVSDSTYTSNDASTPVSSVQLGPTPTGISLPLPQGSIVVSSEDGNLTEPCFIGPDLGDVNASEGIGIGTEGMESESIPPTVTTLLTPSEDTVAVRGPMDGDGEEGDEEMSGLRISCTFSVCPTSGVRVDASDEPETVEEATSNIPVEEGKSEGQSDTNSMLVTSEEVAVTASSSIVTPAPAVEKVSIITTDASKASAAAEAISSVVNAMQIFAKKSLPPPPPKSKTGGSAAAKDTVAAEKAKETPSASTSASGDTPKKTKSKRKSGGSDKTVDVISVVEKAKEAFSNINSAHSTNTTPSAGDEPKKTKSKRKSGGSDTASATPSKKPKVSKAKAKPKEGAGTETKKKSVNVKVVKKKKEDKSSSADTEKETKKPIKKKKITKNPAKSTSPTPSTSTKTKAKAGTEKGPRLRTRKASQEKVVGKVKQI